MSMNHLCRNEGATEGNVSSYPMLTHSGVDDGTHRGKDTLYCVDVHVLLKVPVLEMCGCGRKKEVNGLFPIASATYPALRRVVLLKVVPFFELFQR